MFRRLVVLVLVLGLLPIHYSQSAQILGLFAHPGKSHFDFFRPMFVALAERGHNISMYSYFPLKQPMQNYTDYVFEGMPLMTDMVDLQTIETESLLLGQPFRIPTFFMLHNWGLRSCKVAFSSPLIAQLLSSRQRYDVIILEHFANDCMTAVAHLLDAPVIALSSCAIMPWHYQRMGTPFINSIMPMNFLPYVDEMNFVARVNNFMHFHIVNMLYNLLTQPATDALISQRFGPGVPPVNEIVKNTSLMLINQHHTLTGNRPYAANVVEVGGLQVGAAKPLPTHLQHLFDSSKLGIIYISWGSMVNPNTLPTVKLQALFDAISQFPSYTFVMRWKNQTLPDHKPQNLYTYEWLPQRDLLCHPQVKAFVTHGGLLGTTEAVHCGVPMLVTPFYGDQFLNAGAIVQRRLGVIVNFVDFDEPHLTQALSTLLEESFAYRVKRSTLAFRQRALDPLELAIWWIEHVIETNGAPQSQSVARHINWFIYNSIDVYIFCLSIALLWIIAVWKLFKLLKRLASKHGAAAKQKTKQQ